MSSSGSKQLTFAVIAATITIFAVVLFMMFGSEKEKRVVSRDAKRIPLPPSSQLDQSFSAELARNQEFAPEENDPQKMALRGDQYFEDKLYGQAIELYLKVIKLDPKDVDTYNDLGLSYYYTGSPDLAVNTLRKGTKINPRFQRIWLSLGFVLGSTGNIEDAKSSLKKAADLNPNNDVGQEAMRILKQIQ